MSQTAVDKSRSTLPQGRAKAPKKSSPHPRPRRWRAYKIHKWAGLISALWLMVLGVTGFFLDHRDWQWMWQWTVPEYLMPDAVVKKSGGATRLYRIDPKSGAMLSGGPQGLWRSKNGGLSWEKTRFESIEGAPWISAVLEDSSSGWDRLLLATDEGVWLSEDGGATARPFALNGVKITGLAQGAEAEDIIGVAEKSRVFSLTANSGKVSWINLGKVVKSEPPRQFNLSRVTHDLHFGRGITAGIGSLLINDIGGVLMTALPVTGLLFWWLPRRWKARRDHDHKKHRNSMRSLYSLHATWFGIISVIPVVYLSITGILIDHRDVLNGWMKSIKIDRAYLPPVYDMGSWDGQIYTIAGYPGEPGKFSLGTRGGLYTTTNGGADWKRENLPGSSSAFIWALRRIGEDIYIGGMGSPNYVKKNSGPWEMIKGVGHMPSDMTIDTDGRVAWKSHKGLMVESPEGGFVKREISLPREKGVPLFYIIDGLHSGAIIHAQWKWVNDFVSVLAVILCVTGILRWWRKKKISLSHLTIRRRESMTIKTGF